MSLLACSGKLSRGLSRGPTVEELLGTESRTEEITEEVEVTAQALSSEASAEQDDNEWPEHVSECSESAESVSVSEDSPEQHIAPPKATLDFTAAVKSAPALKPNYRNTRALDSDGFQQLARQPRGRANLPRGGVNHAANPRRNDHRTSSQKYNHNRHGRNESHQSEHHRRDNRRPDDKSIVVGTGNFHTLRAAKVAKERNNRTHDPAGVFVSRLHRDTTSSQLSHHIQNILTGVRPRLLQLKSRREDCSSFRIIVPDSQVRLLLDTDLWPSRVIARPYRL